MGTSQSRLRTVPTTSRLFNLLQPLMSYYYYNTSGVRQMVKTHHVTESNLGRRTHQMPCNAFKRPLFFRPFFPLSPYFFIWS